jgi:hypothetical protein
MKPLRGTTRIVKVLAVAFALAACEQEQNLGNPNADGGAGAGGRGGTGPGVGGRGGQVGGPSGAGGGGAAGASAGTGGAGATGTAGATGAAGNGGGGSGAAGAGGAAGAAGGRGGSGGGAAGSGGTSGSAGQAGGGGVGGATSGRGGSGGSTGGGGGGTTGAAGTGGGGAGGTGGATGGGAGTTGAAGAGGGGAGGTGGATGGVGGTAGAPGTGGTGTTLAAPTLFTALPSAARVQLTWVPPSSAAYAGSLLLRGTAPVNVTPSAGTTYTSGEIVGGATVLVVGDTASHLDTPLTNGTTYYYQAFAFTGTRQYSAGVAASAVPHVLATQFGSGTSVGIGGFTGATRGMELRFHPTTGYHVLVRSGAAGATEDTISYVHCASSCVNSASWTTTALASLPTNYDARLALDQQGMPRVVLQGAQQRLYRSCVAGCDAEASWSTVTLPLGLGGRAGIVVDEQNRVWVAVSSGNTIELGHCASGCTSAANWLETPAVSGTAINVVDLQISRSGQFALLYSQSSNPFSLRHASCQSGCDQSSAWSNRAVFTTGGTPYGPEYRFLDDGRSARLFGRRVDSLGAGFNEYRACDTCAPGVPPLLFQMPATTVHSFDVNEHGQPRFLVGTDASGYDLYSCDLACNLSTSWTAVEVIAGTPAGSDRAYKIQMLPGDRPILLLWGGGAAVSIRGAAVPDTPPLW